MKEFLGRWALVGLVADAVLALAGASLGSWIFWALAAFWFGFWNAVIRPGILRMGWSGNGLYGALFLSLLMLNGVLFLGSSAWLPGATLPGRLGLLWTTVCVSITSFLLSSRFRSHDGGWHWISYHGVQARKHVSR